MEARPLPPLFETRSPAVQTLLAAEVPALLGGIAGLLLSPALAAYVAIQVLATVGGVAAGIEHHKLGQAALRGLCAGFFFGGAIILGHAIQGGPDHNVLPRSQIVLPIITTVFGALLAVIGALIRRRLTHS